MKKYLNNRGVASMAEIVLVGGIFLLLMSLGTFSLARFQSSSSLTTVVDTFIADFKNQQIKAMQGDTESGTSPDNYGIHFDSTSYTLFKGTYLAGDPNNFKVNLPPSIQVSTQMKIFGSEDPQIIFIKGNAKLAGCCSIANTITFNDNSANIRKTITVNELGAITLGVLTEIN